MGLYRGCTLLPPLEVALQKGLFLGRSPACTKRTREGADLSVQVKGQQAGLVNHAKANAGLICLTRSFSILAQKYL